MRLDASGWTGSVRLSVRAECGCFSPTDLPSVGPKSAVIFRVEGVTYRLVGAALWLLGVAGP